MTAPERLLKPPNRVPFINERTGQMAREWELYFLNLLGRTDYVESVTVNHTVDLTQVHLDLNDLDTRLDAVEGGSLEQYAPIADICSKMAELDSIVASWPLTQGPAQITGSPSPSGGNSYFPSGW